uniref:RanBP2-type domain-containing protein n=1 Tax=Globisporangium ultimum (strain ATCC 200006 / CBS 805.95 / DAOM BR144) TaxID=431595 RepID=K3XC00_GLOUD
MVRRSASRSRGRSRSASRRSSLRREDAQRPRSRSRSRSRSERRRVARRREDGSDARRSASPQRMRRRRSRSSSPESRRRRANESGDGAFSEQDDDRDSRRERKKRHKEHKKKHKKKKEDSKRDKRDSSTGQAEDKRSAEQNDSGAKNANTFEKGAAVAAPEAVPSPAQFTDVRSFFDRIKVQEAGKERVGTIHASGIKPPMPTALSSNEQWECVKRGCGHKNMKKAASCSKCGAMKRLSEWR